MEFQTMLQNVKEYCDDHEEEFIKAIEALDDYNGYLGDDRWREMSQLAEDCYGMGALELIELGKYSTELDLEEQYYRFNVYGNLESCMDYERDYSDYLSISFVAKLYEEYQHLQGVPETIVEIFEEYENDGWEV